MKLLISLIIALSLYGVVSAKELIVVGAEWCPFCIKQKQYMKDNPEIIQSFDMQYLDVDEHPELVKKLNIKIYPSSFIFDDNHKKIGELRGFTSQKFKDWIKKYE
jgi:glutaredoxin